MLKTRKNKYITATAGIALLAAILIMFYFVLPRISASTAALTQQPPSTQPSSMKDVSTPDLILQAFDRGEITGDQRLLYLAYALYDDELLPSEFHGDAKWDGTGEIIYLSKSANTSSVLCSMSPSARSELLRYIRSNITCD